MLTTLMFLSSHVSWLSVDGAIEQAAAGIRTISGTGGAVQDLDERKPPQFT